MKKLIFTLAVCLFALNGMAQKHDWAGFGRFAKENAQVELVLKDTAFALYDEDAKLMLSEGEYQVFVGTSQPDNRSVALTGKKPYCFDVVCKKTEQIQ